MNDADRLNCPECGPEQLDPLWDLIQQGELAPRHFDRSGNEISMRDWVRLRAYDDLHGHRYARIARTVVGPYVISTVWLGLDHRMDDGPPMIFETMVFMDGDGDEQWRYANEQDARNGHDRIVNEVRLLEAAQ